MSRNALVGVVCVLFVLAPAQAGASKAVKKKSGSGGSLVTLLIQKAGKVIYVAKEVLDELPKKETETVCNLLSKGFQSQQTLVVARESVDVQVEKEVTNWLGGVWVRVTVPSQIH